MDQIKVQASFLDCMQDQMSASMENTIFMSQYMCNIIAEPLHMHPFAGFVNLLLVANFSNMKWCKKKLKNYWNPGIWVHIWENSMGAVQWIPTWQGLYGFHMPPLLCGHDRSGLSKPKMPVAKFELPVAKYVYRLPPGAVLMVQMLSTRGHLVHSLHTRGS